MKRFLVVVAVAIAAVTASAQELLPLPGDGMLRPVTEKINMTGAQPKAKVVAPKKTVTPTGTPEYYSLSGGIYDDWYGMKFESDVVAQIAIDGNDVYFKTLFPGYQTQMWTKGEIQGDSIVVPRNQILKTIDYWGDGTAVLDFYPMLYKYCKDSITIITDRDIAFKKDGDRIYFDDDKNNPQYAIGLAAYHGDSYLGLWAYGLVYNYEKVTENLTPVTVPSTAKISSYTYGFKDATGAVYDKLGRVAVDGNDVYFDYLTQGQGWVKGTRDGNTVTVPSGQYIGLDTGYYLYFNATTGNTSADGSTISFAGKADALTFTVDGDKYKQNGTEFASAMTKGGYIYNSGSEFTVSAYSGPQPAVPADPQNVGIYNHVKDQGMVTTWCYIPMVDVDGNYITADYLEAAVYVDGEMFTFSPDDGYEIDEDMTWIKAGWCDESGWMLNFAYNQGPCFWIKVEVYNEIGFQLRYTVHGVENYSNIVYKCSDGSTHTVSTDITDVNTKAKNANVMYNIAGQRVNSNAKGIIIKNGKKFLNM